MTAPHKRGTPSWATLPISPPARAPSRRTRLRYVAEDVFALVCGIFSVTVFVLLVAAL